MPELDTGQTSANQSFRISTLAAGQAPGVQVQHGEGTAADRHATAHDRHRLATGTVAAAVTPHSRIIRLRRYHRGMAMNDGVCVTAAIAAGAIPAAALFRSLADETRLRIVARLAAGEARVVDLTGELGLAQSTVSKHLACLRGCGLVDYRAQGRQSFYALTRPELMDLLQAAEGVLAATGAAAAPCPDSSPAPRAAVA
jgi:ArsR family transcriptional regulator, cadmium/lead-responsive transcriptional repressor